MLVALAVVMSITNQGLRNPVIWISLVAGLAYLFVCGVMLWSSRVAEPKLRDRLLNSLIWRGDEQVLVVGSGRGLLLSGAAKRLTSGKATGIDLKGDAPELPFKDATFDIVLSSLALHNIPTEEERNQALAEIVRVLKPGGQLAIFDLYHTAAYAQQLTRLGLTDVHLSGLTFYWCVPNRSLTARGAGAFACQPPP